MSALAGGAVAVAWIRRQVRNTPPRDTLRHVPLALAARASDSDGALSLLDVDNLKGVNERENFDVGDRLLNAIEDVLRRALPAGHALERLESGRFLLWLPATDLAAARDQTEHLRGIASTCMVEGQSGVIARTLSTGIVQIQPGESRSRAMLRADTALAEAKRRGGDCSIAAAAHTEPSLAPSRSEIEQAIRSEALEYHVQPIVDLEARRIRGVEALLRWNRDDGSIIGPGTFLDMLDRIPEAGSDLFPQLAIEVARPFLDADPDVYCTFNVTGAVLDERGGPGCAWLTALMDALPSDRVVFEIVENAVIIRPDRARDLITRLRERGIRVALDDFGTGLSNLERLRQFPVDVLKVDRIFIDGLHGDGREEAILSSLVHLARDLGIDLIAEGIETEAQADTIRDLGIRYGQGYFFGRPAPAANWLARVRND